MKKILFMAYAAAILLTFAACSVGVPNTDGCWEGGVTGEPVVNTSGDQFEEFADNPFIATSEEPTSTFSIDADGASYAYMR